MDLLLYMDVFYTQRLAIIPWFQRTCIELFICKTKLWARSWVFWVEMSQDHSLSTVAEGEWKSKEVTSRKFIHLEDDSDSSDKFMLCFQKIKEM